MIVRILRFILGYAEITVVGGFSERLLNLCMLRGISVWGLSHDKQGRLSFYTERRNLKGLAQASDDAFTVIKIGRTIGVPTIAKRCRKRYALVFGPVAVALLLAVSSCFIWNIKVIGNCDTPSEEIISALRENGFYEGTYKNGKDYSMLAQKTILKVPTIVWMSINVRGTCAEIEVRERVMPPEIVDTKTCSDMLAAKSGLVKYVAAFGGTALVKAGDSVEKGQVLISGEITYKDGTVEQCASYGQVTADTWYTFEYRCPKVIPSLQYTGRKKTKCTLNLFGRELKLFANSSISYEKYDNIIEKKQLCLGGTLYLPFSVTCDTYREVRTEAKELTEEEQILMTRYELRAALREEIGDGEIISKKFVQTMSGDTLVTRLDAKCTEDIGVIVPK